MTNGEPQGYRELRELICHKYQRFELSVRHPVAGSRPSRAVYPFHHIDASAGRR